MKFAPVLPWRRAALLSVAGMTLLAVACGGSSSSKTSPSPTTAAKTTTTAQVAPTSAPSPTPGPAGTDAESEQTVTISLTEFKITGQGGAALGPLKAGEVKFDVHNDGKTQHEFVLIKTDADPASLPYDSDAYAVIEDAAGESPGEADDIEAGQSKVATMRVTPGKYVFICNVAAHYASGMRGQLIVQ